MIYVASKVKHAPIWLSYKHRGYPINSTWIYEAKDKESPSLPDLWRRCVSEASTALVTVLYVEPGDHLKGALVEVGCALSNGRVVIVVGEVDGSWKHHHSVLTAKTLDDAMITAENICSSSI